MKKHPQLRVRFDISDDDGVIGKLKSGFAQLGTFTALLFIEPNGFNIKAALIFLVVALFIASIVPAYTIAKKSNSRILSITGALALAILFSFIGLFIIAGIAWLIALSHSA
jgi:predicted branched-subunit amino acid permease